MIKVSDFCKLYQSGDNLLFEYTPINSIFKYDNKYYNIKEDVNINIKIKSINSSFLEEELNKTLNLSEPLFYILFQPFDYKFIFIIESIFMFEEYNEELPDNIIELLVEPFTDNTTKISLEYSFNHLPQSFKKLVSLSKDIICECKNNSCICNCFPTCKEIKSYLIFLNYYDLLFSENYRHLLSLNSNEYKNTKLFFENFMNIFYDISLYGETLSDNYIKYYFIQKYIKFYTLEKILFDSGKNYIEEKSGIELEKDYLINKFDFNNILKCIKKTNIIIEFPLDFEYKFNLLDSSTFSTHYTILFNALIDRVIALTVATPSGLSSNPLNINELEKLKI